MSDTLCIDDDVVLFPALTVIDDVVDQHLLIIIVQLRKQDILRSISNTAPQCDISGISSHYLNDTAALMRRGGITHLVDRFHRRIHRCVKADRIIGAGNIQINCTRDTDRIDSACSQLLRTCIRTIATDDDQTINAMLPADLCRLVLPFLCAECRATGCVQNRTALSERI